MILTPNQPSGFDIGLGSSLAVCGTLPCKLSLFLLFNFFFLFPTPLPSEACGRNFVFQVKRGKNNIFFILLDKPQWNRFTRTARGLPKTFVQTFMVARGYVQTV